MNQREAYQEKVEAQIREADADIARLQAKAEQAKAQAKIDYYQKIEELQAKRDVVYRKLEDLRTTGDEAWGELKAGIENAWNDLKTGVQNALAKIQ